jgi:predicted MFS family arabinose efflux permease
VPAESLASPRLWIAFAIMMLVAGLGNGFPVFFSALLAEFGGSRAATALTVTLMWVGGAVLGPVAGYRVDRGDPRRLMTVGLAVTALGLGTAALAPSLALFTIAAGVGTGVGVGLTGMVAQAAVIADAYTRRRGFATGIAFSGSMAGYVLAIPAHSAITAVGWRGALLGWALAVLALVPAVWWAYPARLGRPHAGGAAVPGMRPRMLATVCSVPFAALTVLFTIAPCVGYLATTQHAVYAESLGFSAWEASAMLVAGGMLSTAGRAVAGLASDRLGAPVTGFVSYSMTLLGTLSLVALDLWPGRALAYAYVLFIFLPLGTRATIVSVLVGRIASPGAFGTVFGLLAIGNSLGAAAGPLLSGLIYDLTRSYLAIYLTAVTCVLIALVALVIFVRTTARPTLS